MWSVVHYVCVTEDTESLRQCPRSFQRCALFVDRSKNSPRGQLRIRKFVSIEEHSVVLAGVAQTDRVQSVDVLDGWIDKDITDRRNKLWQEN